MEIKPVPKSTVSISFLGVTFTKEIAIEIKQPLSQNAEELLVFITNWQGDQSDAPDVLKKLAHNNLTKGFTVFTEACRGRIRYLPYFYDQRESVDVPHSISVGDYKKLIKALNELEGFGYLLKVEENEGFITYQFETVS